MDDPFLDGDRARASPRTGCASRASSSRTWRRVADGGASRPIARPCCCDAWRAAIAALGGARDLVIGGKSMGGRMASMLADEVGARGLVCLGYPFHPPGKPEQLRTAHLDALRTPTLIVQGTRDPFGTPDEVAGYRALAGDPRALDRGRRPLARAAQGVGSNATQTHLRRGDRGASPSSSRRSERVAAACRSARALRNRHASALRGPRTSGGPAMLAAPLSSPRLHLFVANDDPRRYLPRPATEAALAQLERRVHGDCAAGDAADRAAAASASRCCCASSLQRCASTLPHRHARRGRHRRDDALRDSCSTSSTSIRATTPSSAADARPRATSMKRLGAADRARLDASSFRSRRRDGSARSP